MLKLQYTDCLKVITHKQYMLMHTSTYIQTSHTHSLYFCSFGAYFSCTHADAQCHKVAISFNPTHASTYKRIPCSDRPNQYANALVKHQYFREIFRFLINSVTIRIGWRLPLFCMQLTTYESRFGTYIFLLFLSLK